jgi:hypothetical protein
VPLVYFDSSAFVKLLAEEAGSDLAAELWDACDAAVASRLAYPEVRAALAVAARSHDIGGHDLNAAEQAWADYWAATRPVELTPAVEAARRPTGPSARAQGRERRPPRQRTGHRRPGPCRCSLGPAPAHRRASSRHPRCPSATRRVTGIR